MIRTAAALCAAAAVAANAASVSFKTCGSGATTVDSISASPYPYVAGQNSTTTTDVTNSAAVTGGSFTSSTTIYGVVVSKSSGDLCALHPCPWPKGAMTISANGALPSNSPAGTYTNKLDVTDSAGNAVFCIESTVEIDAASAVPAVDENAKVNSQELIDAVNAAATTWTAGHNERWAPAMTFKHVSVLCGALEEPESVRLPVREAPRVASVPASFDSRDQWSDSCPSTKAIRDQGACGDCWANAAASSATDRTCIAAINSTAAGAEVPNPYLAAEDILSCCGFLCGSGCSGGYPSAAQSYWVSTGIVDGGPYGSNQGCYDFAIAPCEHHVSGPRPQCQEGGATPSCNKTCANGASWSSSKHFGSTSYSVPSDVASIQAEIMTHGPVEATFTVYSDFPSYKSGVYKQQSQQVLGGHAVKIIGWGTENGTPFWTVANSWNTDWGMDGYFKILRGADECGIESGIVAGLPKL